jgi:serine phosphatase RsbU (regulator of sigma subunit)
MMEGLQYHAETLDIARGDRFILCTDGLLEIKDPISGKTKSWVDSIPLLEQFAGELKTTALQAMPQQIVKKFALLGESEDDKAVLITEV